MTLEQLAADIRRAEADGPALTERTAEYETAGKIFAGKQDD